MGKILFKIFEAIILFVYFIIGIILLPGYLMSGVLFKMFSTGYKVASDGIETCAKAIEKVTKK